MKPRDESNTGLIILLTDAYKSKITQLNKSCSVHGREFTWKNMIRFFFTTQKLKLKQKAQCKCGRCRRQCGELVADHFHIFWGCPAIQPYWSETVEVITHVIWFKLNGFLPGSW